MYWLFLERKNRLKREYDNYGIRTFLITGFLFRLLYLKEKEIPIMYISYLISRFLYTIRKKTNLILQRKSKSYFYLQDTSEKQLKQREKNLLSFMRSLFFTYFTLLSITYTNYISLLKSTSQLITKTRMPTSSKPFGNKRYFPA